MHRTVICDTSVIFYLHRLRCLSLLKELYGSIVVPETVAQELEKGREKGEDVADLVEYPWIRIKQIRIPKVIGLMTDLGPGEAGVMALALEEPDVLMILDDLLDIPSLSAPFSSAASVQMAFACNAVRKNQSMALGNIRKMPE